MKKTYKILPLLPFLSNAMFNGDEGRKTSPTAKEATTKAEGQEGCVVATAVEATTVTKQKSALKRLPHELWENVLEYSPESAGNILRFPSNFFQPNVSRVDARDLIAIDAEDFSRVIKQSLFCVNFSELFGFNRELENLRRTSGSYDPANILIFCETEQDLKITEMSGLQSYKRVTIYGSNVKKLVWQFRERSSLKSLVTFLPNLTEIFLSAQQLSSVRFNLSKNVTKISNYFLQSNGFLKSLDLRSFTGVKVIESNFLLDCHNLTDLVLPNNNQIATLGDNFLANCAGLQEFPLDSLAGVTTIGDNFLTGCIGVKELNLTPLVNVTKIGNNFLAGCTELNNLDLSSFTNVTEIGDNFLKGFKNLTSLNLSSLTKVTKIRSNFLANCFRLQNLDLSALTNVTTISSNFLSGNHALTTVNLNGLTNVTSIGSEFLRDCYGITALDLSSFRNVTDIRNSFLQNCGSLSTLDLTSLTNVTTIGDDFLAYCRGIVSADLSGLTNVTSIGFNFLLDCSSLASVDLNSLKNVKKIERNFQNIFGFLRDCAALKNSAIQVKDLPIGHIIRIASADRKAGSSSY